MKTFTGFSLLLLYAMCLITFSCSPEIKDSQESTEIEYDYLPVKLVGSDMWSILNVKTGEVLFKDEFKNQPSPIYNDVFVVENGNGTYDYYNINNIKTPINKTSYYMAADFVGSDVTPATLPDKEITLINNRCETVATLDKSIKVCFKFREGLAPFMTYSDKMGFVDKTGKIVIDAKYDDGQYFHDGISVCWINDEYNEMTTYYVIDKSGKELYSFTSNDYRLVGQYSNGFLPVADDKEVTYLDRTGKQVYTLCNLADTARYSFVLCTFSDGRSVFCEGDMFGLKDKDNNIILRAKYDYLCSIGDGMYIAQKDKKYGIIDFNDKSIIDFKYEGIGKLRKNIFLVDNGKSKTLINDKGEDAIKVNFSEYSLQQIMAVVSDCPEPDLELDNTMYEDSLVTDTAAIDTLDYDSVDSYW